MQIRGYVLGTNDIAMFLLWKTENRIYSSEFLISNTERFVSC